MKKASGYYLFLTLFLFFGCTRYPDAAYFESDGIVSVKAVDLQLDESWSAVHFNYTRSLKSESSINGAQSGLSVQIYISQPGNYGVWVLASVPDTVHSSIDGRISDEEDFLTGQFQVQVENSPVLKWSNKDSENGEPVFVQFERTGLYTMNLHAMSSEDVIIHKLHLILNNEHTPSGIGFPETTDPGVDPRLAKRDEPDMIPPAYHFGGLKTDVIPGLNSLISNYSHTESRDFTIKPVERIDEPDFKTHPAYVLPKNFLSSSDSLLPGDYDDSVRMNYFIEQVQNPGAALYEVPFLAVDFPFNEKPDEIENIQNYSSQWAGIFFYNSIMLLPSEEMGPAEEVTEKLIQKRNRLFPFLYSLTHRYRATGDKPVTNPSSSEMQFQLGEAFLVAPILNPGDNERSVYFPEGTWIDQRNGRIFDGGGRWVVDGSVNNLPVFVKAGSIIPYKPDVSHPVSGTYSDLILEIMRGGVSAFRLYEDDGWSMKYREGEFATTAYRYFEHEDYSTFTIGATVGRFDGQELEKHLTIRIKDTGRPQEIFADNDPMAVGSNPGSWSFDEAEKILTIQWLQTGIVKTDFRINW
jgi:hypothetical protein